MRKRAGGKQRALCNCNADCDVLCLLWGLQRKHGERQRDIVTEQGHNRQSPGNLATINPNSENLPGLFLQGAKPHEVTEIFRTPSLLQLLTKMEECDLTQQRQQLSARYTQLNAPIRNVQPKQAIGLLSKKNHQVCISLMSPCCRVG